VAGVARARAAIEESPAEQSATVSPDGHGKPHRRNETPMHPRRLVMANYMPPWLDQPSYAGPRHKIPRSGQILIIAAALVVVSFFVALITAIVMAGGGG
jgi:hypothetical protein